MNTQFYNIIRDYEKEISELIDLSVINYNSETKLLKNLKEIYYFSKCLEAPHTKFKYSELLEAHNIDDLPLNSELYEMKKNFKNIQDEILQLKNDYDDDPTYNQIELDKLEVEEKKLSNQIPLLTRLKRFASGSMLMLVNTIGLNLIYRS